jgi:predicted phage replisome organizer
MSETKRYYWLKLNENFFDDETIGFIEDQENGKEYCLIYLKLCLKSLKNDGYLFRSIGENILPYDFKAIAKLVNSGIDTVMASLSLFESMGLISKLDNGTLYMSAINEMIGTETNKAVYMRTTRLKQKALLIDEGNNVLNGYPEKEIKSKEIKSKNKIESKKNEYGRFISYLKSKAKTPSKVTSTKAGEDFFNKIDNKKQLIKDYIDHQNEKLEFAVRITSFMEDYETVYKGNTSLSNKEIVKADNLKIGHSYSLSTFNELNDGTFKRDVNTWVIEKL